MKNKGDVGIAVFFCIMLAALFIPPVGYIVGTIVCISVIAIMLFMIMARAEPGFFEELVKAFAWFPNPKTFMFGQKSFARVLPAYIILLVLGVFQKYQLLSKLIAVALAQYK